MLIDLFNNLIDYLWYCSFGGNLVMRTGGTIEFAILIQPWRQASLVVWLHTMTHNTIMFHFARVTRVTRVCKKNDSNMERGVVGEKGNYLCH